MLNPVQGNGSTYSYSSSIRWIKLFIQIGQKIRFCNFFLDKNDHNQEFKSHALHVLFHLEELNATIHMKEASLSHSIAFKLIVYNLSIYI